MTVDIVLEDIKEICKKYKAKEVILFGSRAKGTALERSDIDIAVSGIEDIEDLKDEIEEIPTLYKIDIVNIDTCKNNLLVEDIKEYGKNYYRRYESFKK